MQVVWTCSLTAGFLQFSSKYSCTDQLEDGQHSALTTQPHHQFNLLLFVYSEMLIILGYAYIYDSIICSNLWSHDPSVCTFFILFSVVFHPKFFLFKVANCIISQLSSFLFRKCYHRLRRAGYVANYENYALNQWQKLKLCLFVFKNELEL